MAVAIGIAAIAAAAVGGMSRRFAVVDDSMRPAFEPGDWVIALRRLGAPTRGDVVIFTHVAYPGLFLIKRVVGLPGEEVAAIDGQISINGRELADRWGDGSNDADADGGVPEGAIWVLGDNRRSSSADSRVLGAIRIEDVGWKVVARYWPVARAERIRP